jgi:hypothetical protein
LSIIEWINELIRFNSEYKDDVFQLLDVGTGASAIYALIGSRYFGFNVLASEIDEEALHMAAENCKLNGLVDNVELVLVSESNCLQQKLALSWIPDFDLKRKVNTGYSSDMGIFSNFKKFLLHCNAEDENRPNDYRGPIRKALANTKNICLRSELQSCEDAFALSLLDHDNDQVPRKEILSAVMCNPPFYDRDEIISPVSHSTCTGCEREMRTDGGEVILSIIVHSFRPTLYNTSIMVTQFKYFKGRFYRWIYFRFSGATRQYWLVHITCRQKGFDESYTEITAS